MDLKFKSGNELVFLKLNREKKKVQISSSKTFYQYHTVKWKMLFDKGKEKVQEAVTDKLNDEQFRLSLIAAFKDKGYIYDGS